MSDRPVYELLPLHWDPDGVMGQIMLPTDQKLSGLGQLMQGLPLWLNPALCPTYALDYMAFVLGFPVWDTRWTETQKRSVYQVAQIIRRRRGTLDSALILLGAIGIAYGLWVPGRSYLTLKMTAKLGAGEFEVYFGLDARYPHNDPIFAEVRSVVAAFLPAGLKATVGHYKFYLGISKLSHKMFNSDYPRF